MFSKTIQADTDCAELSTGEKSESIESIQDFLFSFSCWSERMRVVSTDPRISDIFLMDTFWSFLGLFIIKINKDSVFTSTTDLLGLIERDICLSWYLL